MIVLALTFLFLWDSPSKQFEGIVESKNLTTDETGSPQEYVMTMYVKKDMVKIKTSAIGASPSSTMIYRADLRMVWMINDEDRMYYEIPQDDVAEQYYGGDASVPVDEFRVRRTGKTRTIQGYPCEQLFITRGDMETELWGTKKLGNLFKTISAAIGDEHAQVADDWTAEVTRLGLFPLLSTTKIAGIVVDSQEVTKIQMKALPGDEFSIPPGYRKQDINRMLEEMEEGLDKDR